MNLESSIVKSKCTVVYASYVQLSTCKLFLTVDHWLVGCVNS